MHIVSEQDWRAHRAEVADLLQAVIILARGQELMSTATAAALAKLGTIETKLDSLIAAKESADAAALAADEADAASIDAAVDRIGAKIDAAMPAPVAASDTVDTGSTTTL